MQGPAHAVQLWLHIYNHSKVSGLHLLSCLFTISLLYTKCPPFCSHACKWLACLTYTIARTVLTIYNCAYIKLSLCFSTVGELRLNNLGLTQGGRLNLYREVKKAPSTERYVPNIRTVGGGVSRWRWRPVDTPGCHIGRGCAGCVTGERWRTSDTFLAIYPALRHLRLKLFNCCHNKSINFYHLTLQDKSSTFYVNMTTPLYSSLLNYIHVDITS